MIVQAVKVLYLRNGRLYSAHNDTLWRDNQLEATCGVGGVTLNAAKGEHINVAPRHSADRIPAEGCSCGIYCVDSITRLYLDHRNLFYHSTRQGMPIAVLLNVSGKVIPYTKGYRAQHAEITGIFKQRCTTNTNCGKLAVVEKQLAPGKDWWYFAACEEHKGALSGRSIPLLQERLERLAERLKVPLLEPYDRNMESPQ